MILLSIVRLLRPEQWVKNIFIFLPMFFGGFLFDVSLWQEAIITFFSFAFMSSSIYCLNDIIDVESDRTHPRKRNRPIASGAITTKLAWICFFVLIALSFAIAFCGLKIASIKVVLILSLYLVLNIAYCYGLKRIAIVDVFILSIGFVLRLLAGGVSEGIMLSPWIVLMTFLLALFLAFAKRRDDVMLQEIEGVETRKSTRNYNLAFMNATLGIIASITMVCYILYTVSIEVTTRFNTQFLYISSIFVLAGMLRYLQIAIVSQQSGSPTKVLLKDRFIQGCIFCWILFFVVIIY